MSEEENKALVRHYYEELDAAAKDKRGTSFLDDFVAPNFVNHNPSPGFTPDLEGLKQAYNYFLAASPDSVRSWEKAWASNIGGRWRASGRRCSTTTPRAVSPPPKIPSGARRKEELAQALTN